MDEKAINGLDGEAAKVCLGMALQTIRVMEILLARRDEQLAEAKEELDRLRGLVTFGGSDAAGDVVLGVPVAQPVDEQLEREWRAQFPTECGDDACGLCACGERPPF